MKIALIGDIHGNLPALDAVLAEIDGDVDAILCLGDVAVGPQPVETVERVRDLNCPVLMGNWDAWFLDGFPQLPEELGRRLIETARWWASHLGPDHLRFMRGFEQTAQLALQGEGRLVAFHGSPRSYEEGILATTSADDLDRMLDGIDASVIVCGHTHYQMLRRHDDTILVNPGSVGLSFCGKGPIMRIAPWAEYGMITLEDRRLAVDLRRTAFDAAAFADLIRSSGMPHAEWWAGLWTQSSGPVPVAAA
jgi:putative phosphoesterase